MEEPCPKCAHPEMSFYTMQLRSADEGSTVFYECLNKACGHKFSVRAVVWLWLVGRDGGWGYAASPSLAHPHSNPSFL